MNSYKVEFIKCLVFGVWYKNITLSRYVRILNTKHKIQNALAKSCFSDFLRGHEFYSLQGF